jgi:succinate-semialdehyde dehydrogenase/glutarate-semialdehyde dehydrogenase
MSFQTVNPATDEVLATYHYLSSSLLEIKIQKSYAAFKQWRRSPLSQRREFLFNLAAELRKSSQDLSELITAEMGKPILQSVAEVEKCAVTCEGLSEHFESWLAPEQKAGGGTVYKEPLGPLFAIMPWNFPLWQLIRCGVPALAGGNTVILKHSNLVAGTAEMMEKIFSRASGHHGDLLVSLCIDHKQSELVLGDARVAALTFTGSTAGGKAVAASAGAHLKKVVLELGGSDAYLVCEDADIPFAAEKVMSSRLINSGQSCIAAKRFFVHEKVSAEFLKHSIEFLKTQKVGLPLEPNTKVGPLAHKKFKQQLVEQVEKLKAAGAVSLWKSQGQAETSAFAEVELLRCDPNQSVFHSEEIFGPVGLYFEVSSMEAAVIAANESSYGLGAAVFSKDVSRATELARSLDCGFVAINDFVKTDLRLPFGGIKKSGFGRELSREGFLEFLNLKTVVIPLAKA